MEFWGIEVKPGQTIKVPMEEEMALHLSQAALGEHKKATGNDSIILSVKVDGKTLVLGTLSAGKIPQASFDVIFDKEIELSHNWKNGSVYFLGYMAHNENFFRSATEEDDGILDSSDEEAGMELQLENEANGKPEPKAKKSKAAVKPLVAVETEKDDESDDDSEDSSDDDDDNEAQPVVDLGDSDGSDDSDDMSDDSDEDEMDEDEETPKKAEPKDKKRGAGSAIKTPVPAKKVKLASPQKTDGKKGTVHSATPHPKKAIAKTSAANTEKSKAAATPKSSGSIGCHSCSKKFNTDKALESHSKAKHTGK